MGTLNRSHFYKDLFQNFWSKRGLYIYREKCFFVRHHKELTEFISKYLDVLPNFFIDENGVETKWFDLFIEEKINYYEDRYQLPW